MYNYCNRNIINEIGKQWNKNIFKISNKYLSLTNKNNAKIALIGSNGSIGSKLSMLLKLNPLIHQISLYDVTDTKGIMMDLSHIDTRTKVINFSSMELFKCLSDVDIIAIAAGFPRKPGMTRDELFKANVDIIHTISKEIIKLDTEPKIAVITNPVNSIIPFMYEYIMKNSTKQYVTPIKSRLFGITTLDSVRANTFYAEYLNQPPSTITVPVIGGHSDSTIIPLFSLANIPLEDEVVAQQLTIQIQQAGTKVVEAYGGKGSASISMAYAAHRFINALVEAQYGKTTYECAYVNSIVQKDINFFAQMLSFNPKGIQDYIPFGNLYKRELKLLEAALPILKADQEKGIEMAIKYS